MWEQFGQLMHRILSNAREHIAKPGKRLHRVLLAPGNEAQQHGSSLAAIVATEKRAVIWPEPLALRRCCWPSGSSFRVAGGAAPAAASAAHPNTFADAELRGQQRRTPCAHRHAGMNLCGLGRPPARCRLSLSAKTSGVLLKVVTEPVSVGGYARNSSGSPRPVLPVQLLHERCGDEMMLLMRPSHKKFTCVFNAGHVFRQKRGNGP